MAKQPSILFSLNSNIIRYEEFDDQQKNGKHSKPITAHDWRPYKTKFFDDGTQTFFWYFFY